MVSGALGLGDIGAVIEPKDYDKVEADDYVMHEDGERIIFLIKSKLDEYCFTNKALIHVDGKTVTSKKRILWRFDYSRNAISNVYLETAGTIDLDAEIKFTMGENEYSIDVNKKHIEQLKDLYKSLITIGHIQYENAKYLEYAQKSLDAAVNSMCRASTQNALAEEFTAINEYSNGWLLDSHRNYVVKDFGHVFDKFIKN